MATTVTATSPAWERMFQETIRARAMEIVKEEAEAAAQRVIDRTRELGASIAIELSRMAEVRTMGERITIDIRTDQLRVPSLEPDTGSSCSNGGAAWCECRHCTR